MKMKCTPSSTPAPHCAFASCSGSRILWARERCPGADGGDDAKGGGRSNGTKDGMRLFCRRYGLELFVRIGVVGMKFEMTSLAISGMTGCSRLCSQKEHKK